MPENMLTEPERQALGERIDRLRHAKRLTLTELASKAGYDERTARNIIQGKPTRYKTLMDFCESIGISSINSQADIAEFADEPHGGYSKKRFKSYIGHYSAYRWSYGMNGDILHSCFEVSWSNERGLVFSEYQRYRDSNARLVDFSQAGEIYCNEEAGLIHFLTTIEGMLRLITLTKLQGSDMLKGAVLSQAMLAFYRRPAVSPMFLRKLAEAPTSVFLETAVGELHPGAPGYEEAACELRSIERDVLLSTMGMEAVTAERPQKKPATVTRLRAVR